MYMGRAVLIECPVLEGKVWSNNYLAGVELEMFEKLMKIYTKRRQKLSKTLETNKIVQTAKLQARCNHARENVLFTNQQNLNYHKMKHEVEKVYLE